MKINNKPTAIWKGWRQVVAVRLAGVAVALGGLGLMGFSTVTGSITSGTQVVSVGDPGCTSSGTTRCLKETQEGATATQFEDSGLCNDFVAQEHPEDDYWHFVVPESAGWNFNLNTSDFSAMFDTGTVTATHMGHADEGGAMFAYVLTPAGSVLEEAIATQVIGEPGHTGFGAFVLSGACAATVGGPTPTPTATPSSTPTATPSATPTPTPSATAPGGPTPTPTPSEPGGPTPTPTPSSGVAGTSTSTPSTGADAQFGLGLLLALAGGGMTLAAARMGRKKN